MFYRPRCKIRAYCRLVSLFFIFYFSLPSATASESVLSSKVLDYNPADTSCGDVLRGLNSVDNKQKGKIYIESDLLIGQLSISYLQGVLDSLTLLLKQSGREGWLDRDALVTDVLNKCMEEGNSNEDLTLMIAGIPIVEKEMEERPLSDFSKQSCPDTGMALIFLGQLIEYGVADEKRDNESQRAVFDSMQGMGADGIRYFNAAAHLIGFLGFSGFPSEDNKAISFLIDFCVEEKNKETQLAQVLEYLIENRSLY